MGEYRGQGEVTIVTENAKKKKKKNKQKTNTKKEYEDKDEKTNDITEQRSGNSSCCN